MPDSPVVAVVVAPGGGWPPGRPAGDAGGERRLVSSGVQLVREAPDAEAVFLWDRVDWLREHRGWSGKLRWVAAPAAGVDWLLFPGLVDSEVVVTNAAGVFDAAMAGYALALVAAICAGLPATLRFQARHQWRHRETKRISGCRAVVVGAGGIGRAIFQMLTNAGVSAQCVARRRRNDPGLGEIAALAGLFTDQLRRYRAGQPLSNVVDKRLGFLAAG